MLKSSGFTLIELIIVVGMIGVLSVIMVPNLTRARTVAQNRAAQAYANNVYKAATAYTAESIGNNLVLGSCKISYTAGAYTMYPSGNTISSCSVSDVNSDNLPEIVVISVTGYTFSLP